METIETGTGRALPAVGRDVCAAVRQAARGGIETRLSIGGRQVAAIVPLDSQENPRLASPGGPAASGRPAGTPEREQRAERIAERVRQAVLELILTGQQGTEADLPELGEVIVIERRAAR